MSFNQIGPSALFEWFKDDWLVSRRAVKLFSVSTVFVLATFPIFSGHIDPGSQSVLYKLLWGVEGVLGTLSIFFLWIGMWRYWLRLDSSTGVLKATSYFLLLFGVWFGAVPYCFFVYRPQVKHGSWAEPPRDDQDEPESTAPWGTRKTLGVIVAGVLTLGVLLPKVIESFGSKDHLEDYSTILTLVLAVGLICVVVYPFVQLFRLGMRRRR